MIFLNSNFLIFMLLPLFVLGFFIMTNKKEIDRYFKKEILEKLVIKRDYLGIFGKNILLFLALFLFVIALARPVKPKDEIELTTKLPTVAVLVDISASMQAKDLFPNRLEFAKHKIKMLIKNSYAKIALYAFSDKLYQISPPTSNKEILTFLIEHLNIPHKLSNSSNLYEALKNIKEKQIILFSDGGDEKNFSNYKALNKDILTYLTATKKGSVIPSTNGFYKDKDNHLVITKANTDIKEISKVINYSYHDEDIKKLSLLSSKTTFNLKEFKELYSYPLYLGSVMMFFAMFSLKRFKFFLLIVLMFYQTPKATALFFDFYDINSANKAYQNKEYKKAIMIYQKIASQKRSPQSYYNLANAYYKNKEYKKALTEYKKVVAKDDELRYKTFFNLANCYYKLKNYNKAYEFYKLAKDIKDTKKVQNNISLVIPYLDLSKKDKIDFDNIKLKDQNNRDFDIKTLLIPITKGKKVENLKNW